jgi:hypothetical protein
VEFDYTHLITSVSNLEKSDHIRLTYLRNGMPLHRQQVSIKNLLPQQGGQKEVKSRPGAVFERCFKACTAGRGSSNPVLKCLWVPGRHSPDQTDAPPAIA